MNVGEVEAEPQCVVDGLPLAGSKPLFKGLNWKVEKGERVLLIGANGAGKTTLQKIIGGKMMTQGVLVLGSSPFHNTDLTSSGSLSYIGGTWQRDVAFAGYNVPLQGDVAAKKMIDGIRGVSEERKDRLKKVLDINDEWRMHTVSEGQRRRVQLCIGLLNEFDVLLLDEATVDLDVLCRADLMKFLKEESKLLSFYSEFSLTICARYLTWLYHYICTLFTIFLNAFC